ncbi:MAG: AAA family ATPase [Desulfitobacteriaceae bacterium]
MQFSHSRVNTFEKCPYQFKLRYLDKLNVVPDPAANDALLVGNALHLGAEKDEKAMLDFYFSQFPLIDDLQINEAMKLTAMLKKLKTHLGGIPGNFKHEYKIERPEFKGFVDLIVTQPDRTVNVYDFKYSNHVKNYLESKQLHLYKFYLEREGFNVNRMGFIFIPKTSIRQKKTEDLYQFRKRLIETLTGMEIQVEFVEYDFQKVKEFWESCEAINEATEFPKNPTNLCDWCSYQKFCQERIDYMLLPSVERRQIDAVQKKVLWIYGAPFTGKTYFANQFPHPLMLNTDGNVKFVDAPFVAIKNEVTVEGRLTKTKLAWTIFKDTIAELEKKQNDFETIILDLLEDTYEHCRLFMYDKLGIEHESDNSFKAWDMVRTEFLSTLKRLISLDYNIILISHEDMSKDVTKRTGDKITRIAPNIQEKAANKIAGMVDIVARVINEDDERFLTFKTSEVEFGGGRLTLLAKKIPLEFEAFVKIYEAVQNQDLANREPKTKRERKAKDTPEVVAETQETNVATEEAVSPEDDSDDEPQPELKPENEGLSDAQAPSVSEPPKRSRRTRTQQ